jgi:hypothetical protein
VADLSYYVWKYILIYIYEVLGRTFPTVLMLHYPRTILGGRQAKRSPTGQRNLPLNSTAAGRRENGE